MVVVALGAAVVARADFKETYGRGREAFQRQSWGDLARLMQQAIDEHPQELKAIRVYGMAFEPYVPHYYLGVARAEQGNCAMALAAWRSSEAYGVIQKLKEHADLRARRAACLGPEVQAAEAEIRKARESARRVAELGRDPVLKGMWSQEGLAAEQTKATKRLEAAAAGLDSAKNAGDEDGIQAAGRMAAQAQQELAAIYSRGEQRRAGLQAALEGELRSRRQAIEALIGPARNLLRETEARPISSAVGRERTDLQQALAAASGATSIRAVDDLDRLRRRLNDASTALRAAVTGYRETDGLRREIETLVGKAGGVLAAARQLPDGAGAQRETSALQQALDAASDIRSVRSGDELQARRRRLDDATVALQEIVDAYLAATPARELIEGLTRQAAATLERARRLPRDAGLQDQVGALERVLEAASGAGSMRSPSELERVRQRLSAELRVLERALDEQARMSEIRQRISGRSRAASGAVERARGLPASAGVGAQLSAAQRSLDAAAKAGSVRSVAELESLLQGVENATAALEQALDEYDRRPAPVPPQPPEKPTQKRQEPEVPAATGPPPVLREAVTAYLSGDFEGTLRILVAESFSDPRARAQALLFRAAAGHALFRMTGSEDEELLRAAAADVRACRRLDAGLEPDRETFSPAFVDFYTGDGGA